MGFHYHWDGRCYICKSHTDTFCDHCGRYICEDHQKRKSISHTFKKFIFCPECAKKNKKAINPKTKVCNPQIDFYADHSSNEWKTS